MSPIVAIPGQPGEKVDSRILPDLLAIIREYKVKVTDGFATGGHAPGGEHPLGLAVDVVPDPDRGGTWDDVDALAKWAEPGQNAPRSPFRWVGYDGDARHGRGDHLHLSWLHPDGRVITARGDIPDHTKDNGGGLSVGKVLTAGPAAGLLDDAVGKAGDVAGDAATAGAKAILNLLWDAFGQEGARILLHIVFVAGGATLAIIGLSRALGVRAPSLSTIAAVTPAGRAAKAAGGAKAAKAS